MEITLGTNARLYQTLINQSHVQISMPILYKLFQLKKACEQQHEFYKSECNALINDFGQRDENGNLIYNENGTVPIDPIQRPAAESKIQSIANYIVSLPDITFTIKELEALKLSLDEFDLFLPFIKEEQGN